MTKTILVKREEEYLHDISLSKLEDAHRREPPGKSRDRLQAAVLRKRGRMLEDIASIVGRDSSTIHRWLHRMECEGPDGRHDRWGPGRPRLLTPEQEGAIEGDLDKLPSESGFGRGSWNSKMVARRIADRFGIMCSWRTAHKISRVISDSTTHTAMENLPIQNMAKSAKGTEEQHGKNVAQKSGLNKAIIQQCWGLLALLLAYKLAGEIIWVAAAYTSQRCNPCGYTHKDNRDGRKFLCKRCGHTSHADCNAGANIEDAGLKKLGPEAMHGQLNLRNLPGHTGNTHCTGVSGRGGFLHQLP